VTYLIKKDSASCS